MQTVGYMSATSRSSNARSTGLLPLQHPAPRVRSVSARRHLVKTADLSAIEQVTPRVKG
jgi:hypothetical protein